MNAADVLWRLIASGDLPAARVPHACEVLEITKHDLAAARARYECPAVPEVPLRSVPAPTTAFVGSFRTPLPPYTPPPVRYTSAGRRRAAERIFATIRVEQVRCDLCGDIIETGDVVVIDRAHHAGCVR